MTRTPAPWIVHNHGKHWNNDAIDDLSIDYGLDGENVCETVYEMDDALLIAAAPDLLEALKDIIKFDAAACDGFNCPDDGCEECHLSKALDKAREAIAKAEGN